MARGRLEKLRSHVSAHVVSLDALRGLTVLYMVAFDHPAIAAALPVWVLHAPWHGFYLLDAVFPAFIFIAGVSLAYSTARQRTFGAVAKALPKLLVRVALLVALGLLVNWAKYGLPLRYMGVLQRIALATLVAWPFARLRPRYLVPIALLLLAAHTGLLLYQTAPGVVPGGFVRPAVEGPQTLGAQRESLAGWVDREVLGIEHTYKQRGYDPEGLLGLLSTVGQMLLGVAFGRALRDAPHSAKRLAWLAVACALALAAGLLLARWVPVNKTLWTSTFVLVSSAAAGLALLAAYLLTDHPGHSKLLNWLVPTGRNALAVYIGMNYVIVLMKSLPFEAEAGRFHGVEALGRMLVPVLAPSAGPAAAMWATLAVSAAHVLFWMILAKLADMGGVYFKL